MEELKRENPKPTNKNPDRQTDRQTDRLGLSILKVAKSLTTLQTKKLNKDN